MLRVFVALALLHLPLWASPAVADGGCPTTLQLDRVVTPQTGMHEWLTVHLQGLEAATGCDPASFTLRLEGQAIAGLRVKSDAQTGMVGFLVERQAADGAAWMPILGSPPASGSRDVAVAVGPKDQAAFAHAGDKPPTVRFAILPDWWILGACIYVVVVLAGLVWVGARSDMLRDPIQPKPAGAPAAAAGRRPFSLGRCQMAFWFVLLTTAFLAIWSVTWVYNGVLTTQSLILLGISGATALGAIGIDQGKATSGTGNLVTNPTVGFFDDLLTDKDGFVLQRLQVFVWTLVLGAISLVSIYRNLSLPAFDETLLTMSGISSGLYVGFKFPEKQS